MVAVKCKCCGKAFSAKRADINRGWGKFCSKSCKAKKQEARTGQYANMIHGNIRKTTLHPYVDNETYLHYKKEYGGIPQFNRNGVYTGFRMTREDLSYGGHGSADWDTPFGEGKY